MTTWRIKSCIFSLAAVVLMMVAGPVHALTLNAGETLTATLENSNPGGFDKFSVFWELNSWDGDMDYTIYSPDPSDSWSKHQELSSLDTPSTTAQSFRSDFEVGWNIDPFDGDTLRIDFSVSDGAFVFNNIDYTNTLAGYSASGIFASAFYDPSISSWNEPVEDTVYAVNPVATNSVYTTAPVPEPTTWILLLTGMLGLSIIRKKRQSR